MMVIITLFTRVLHNLDSVVLIGVILTTLFFSYGNAKRIRARKYIDEDGVKFCLMPRPLFFAYISDFNKKFKLLINSAASSIVEISDIEALNKIKARYHKVVKKAQLKHLSPDYCRLIQNANDIIDVKIMEDPYLQTPRGRISMKDLVPFSEFLPFYQRKKINQN
jgi:SulP family sulfate permease